MRIIYSFNKTGYESSCWEKEIGQASSEGCEFIPFNHVGYLDPLLYYEAANLDQLYRDQHSGLMRMYKDFEVLIQESHADAVLVTNCPPYHPDYLKRLPIYKALYSTDDTVSTYTRNIPYLHAYQHVFYCISAYSRDMDMHTKMQYSGMVNADWLPLGVFDFEFDPSESAAALISKERDIDLIYIGGFWRQKLDALVQIRRAFGRRFRMYGFYQMKHNCYLNIRYGYGAWIKPVSHQQRVLLYQRAKIGFNIHYNEYMLGNQRLYHLPANGVMQICDCPENLNEVYRDGEEIISYRNTTDLIDKARYYLEHENERVAIAKRGYERTMREYRFASILHRAGRLIQQGMQRLGWKLQ